MANTVIQGLGFHHAALKCPDLEQSIAFYEKLGMKFYTSWGEGDGRIAMLDIGDGGILELFAGGTEAETTDPKYIHLALKTDDVEGAYRTALKAGAKPKSEPRVVPLNSKPVKLTLCCAFVYGPGGEEVEFFRVVREN